MPYPASLNLSSSFRAHSKGNTLPLKARSHFSRQRSTRQRRLHCRALSPFPPHILTTSPSPCPCVVCCLPLPTPFVDCLRITRLNPRCSKHRLSGLFSTVCRPHHHLLCLAIGCLGLLSLPPCLLPMSFPRVPQSHPPHPRNATPPTVPSPSLQAPSSTTVSGTNPGCFNQDTIYGSSFDSVFYLYEVRYFQTTSSFLKSPFWRMQTFQQSPISYQRTGQPSRDW